ncbi:MAG: 30S ribosomal protein S27e [Thermoplasmata archaeon]
MDEKKSSFIKVKCADCSNEQITFRKPAMEVKCLVCGAKLSEPTGGEADLTGEIVEEVE